jgi:lipid-A-disaccharide synthase-like uncharacterized protein
MEIIGWTGSILIILVYGLNSYQKIRSDSFLFYLMNMVGGILLIIYSWHKDAPPNIFINAVWVLIALPAIIKLLLKKRTDT